MSKGYLHECAFNGSYFKWIEKKKILSVTFLLGSKTDPVQVTCFSQLVAMFMFLILV